MDVSLTAFVLIVAFVIAGFVTAATRASSAGAGRGLAGAGAWLALTAAFPLGGLLAPDGPLPPQAFMALLMAATLGVAFSPLGRGIAGTVPLWILVGFQGFRLPLELVLHDWAAHGIAPPQMTWTGQNFDIAAGIAALVFAPLVRAKPALAWIPTLVGLGLLVNILRIVATSLPGPMQLFPDPLLLPWRFPHVWIGSVCVVGAMIGHLVALRALLGSSRRRSGNGHGPAAG